MLIEPISPSLLEYKIIGEDATAMTAENNKPLLVVLIVGETARSANINYNGYERNTNPYTENQALSRFKMFRHVAPQPLTPCLVCSLI